MFSEKLYPGLGNLIKTWFSWLATFCKSADNFNNPNGLSKQKFSHNFTFIKKKKKS